MIQAVQRFRTLHSQDALQFLLSFSLFWLKLEFRRKLRPLSLLHQGVSPEPQEGATLPPLWRRRSL